MTVKLLTEHHLKFLGLKEGCIGSSESTLVKITTCWKPHVMAQIILYQIVILLNLSQYDQHFSPLNRGSYMSAHLVADIYRGSYMSAHVLLNLLN